jgi:hypothetical protein
MLCSQDEARDMRQHLSTLIKRTEHSDRARQSVDSQQILSDPRAGSRDLQKVEKKKL